MAKHTKVIELYGLPGCGKTTLRDMLIGNKDIVGTYTTMTSVTTKWKRLSLLRKIASIPLALWFKILRFLFTMPVLSFKDRKFYRSFFEISMAYYYSGKVRVADYVVVDHGIIQSTVSLMNGKINHLSRQQIQKLKKIIESLSNCYFVYCRLSEEESAARIRCRGRNIGRLDVINKDDELLSALKIEKGVFSTIFSELSRAPSVCSLWLDASQETDVCQKELSRMIEEYEN